MRTKRTLATTLVTLVVIALTIPAVLAATELAEDSFASSSYSGGSGWTSNWSESGDDGSPNSGVIQVVSSGCSSNCAQFSALLGVAGTYRISRSTNIEDATTAALTFRYQQNGLGTLRVGTRSGPGDAWTEQTLTGGTSGFQSHTMSIASDASGTTEIRFALTSPLLLVLAASAQVDDVEITATYPTSTSSTSSTTSTTAPSTTTTTEPIITIPSTTLPPLLTTSTTTSPAQSSTSTTTAGGTTTTTPGDDDQGAAGVGGPDGDGGSNEPPGEGEQQTTGASQPTAEELDLASANGIAVDLASGDDFQGFGTGINPLTDMGVRLLSSVESISFDILTALLLGAVIAFFGVRRIKDDEEDLMSQ